MPRLPLNSQPWKSSPIGNGNYLGIGAQGVDGYWIDCIFGICRDANWMLPVYILGPSSVLQMNRIGVSSDSGTGDLLKYSNMERLTSPRACSPSLLAAGDARTTEARGGRNLKNGCDVDQPAGAVAAQSAADDHSAAPDEGLAAGQPLGRGPPKAHAQHLSTALANWPVGEGAPLAAGARGTSMRREYPPAGQRTAGTLWCRQHAHGGRNHKNGSPSPAGRCRGGAGSGHVLWLAIDRARAVTAWPLAILPDWVRSRCIRPTSLVS